MPITVPVRLDHTNDAFYAALGGAAGHTAWQNGPYEANSALYALAGPGNLSGPPLEMYKSTDGGATWAIIDGAHAPSLAGNFGSADRLANVVYVVTTGATSGGHTSFNIASFDLATDLWSTKTPDFGSFSGGAGIAYFIATAADTFTVAYYGGSGQIFRVLYSSGAWGAPAQIDASFGVTIITGFAKDHATNTLWVTYSKRQVAGASPLSPNPVKVVSIDASGTVSSPVTVIADALQFGQTPGSYQTYPGFGEGSALGSTVIFGWQKYYGAAAFVPNRLTFDGAAWTAGHLSTSADDPINSPDPAAIVTFVDGSTCYLLWGNYFNDGSGLAQLRYVTTPDGLTFSAITTAYDFLLNPPAWADSDSPLYIPSAKKLASGRVGILSDISGTDFNEYRTYVEYAAPVAPLAISCGSPPDGTVDIAYSHAFPVTGGTAPITFAIPSGLPPGLALDTVTGIVSGIPVTAGAFAFTVTATDATLATAAAICSITIGAPPPPPSTDVLTVEAWTPDITDAIEPDLNLPQQYSTNDDSITGVRNGVNNVFILVTDNLVTDFLLFYNGLGMTQEVDYTWLCTQNFSCGPWVTTITMRAGQYPKADDVLSAEVFAS